MIQSAQHIIYINGKNAKVLLHFTNLHYTYTAECFACISMVKTQKFCYTLQFCTTHTGQSACLYINGKNAKVLWCFTILHYTGRVECFPALSGRTQCCVYNHNQAVMLLGPRPASLTQ